MQVTAVGAVSWIVDPEDANVLMPIGAIGELLIEGADQARGYLDNEVKTNAVFIRDPTWAIDHHQARRPSRLYKTGDLVRYKDDGTVNYLERKDTQANGKNAAVLLPTNVPYKDTITAIVELDIYNQTLEDEDIQILPSSTLDATNFKWSTMSDLLREVLPSYIIPSSWISIKHLPLSTSAKLDRSKLTNWLSGLPPDHRTARTLSESKT